MWSSFVPILAALSSLYLPCTAQSSTSSSPLSVYTLSAENITAEFIPYGARLTSLIVPDRNGDLQDVALGYDNASQYVVDSATNHTFFGAIVGRFANRIKNGTFTIDGVTSQIPENENGGVDTLHGGKVGYDQRNWTVVESSKSSITFSFLDQALEGFPGNVYTTATFTVGSYPSGPQGEMRPRLTSSMVSTALDDPTPIMLANHVYWNLNGFKAATILNDTTLWMPYSDRYIKTDPILIPTGEIGTVASFPGLDFTSPKRVGEGIDKAQGACGFNCTGIDNAFILDRPANAGPTSSNYPVVSMWSNITGIKLDVSTNQQGLQIYSCNGQNGTVPVKESQQKRNGGSQGAAKYVNKYGCLVIETQAWIDGINHPEWGVNNYEIFSSSTGPALNYATYDFSTY